MSLDDYFFSFIRLFNYSLKCSSLPIQTPGCANFWIDSYLFVACAFTLVLLYALRNILRERAEFKAYEKRKIERAKIADPETMKKVQWQTNNEYDEVDQADLAEKMRQQIIKGKIE